MTIREKSEVRNALMHVDPPSQRTPAGAARASDRVAPFIVRLIVSLAVLLFASVRSDTGRLRTGRAIPDLAKGDFTVSENGIGQEIAAFTTDRQTAVEGEAAARGADDTRVEQRRIFLILFDRAVAPGMATRHDRCADALSQDPGP
jgi:hypothetical protein